MDKNARRRLNRASAEKRIRYSVRKFNLGVASVAVAAFMFFGGNVVSADTLAKTDSSSTSTEKTTSVPDSGEDSRTDDSESAIGKDSTVATVAESNTVSSAASTASSASAEDLFSKVEDKTVKSEATSKSEAVLKAATSQASKASVATSQSAAPAAQSEAPAASPAASAVAESTVVSSEAAAESTAAVEPKVSVEKAASQAASLATASKTPNAVAKSEANSTLAAAQNEVNKGYADFRKSGESGFRSFDPQTGKTTVTKENFLDYFRLNGSATYNSYDGIVTLTPDENYKTGNFSLKSKINMNQSFKLTGGVNLGDKTQERGGADGIGFAFHTGNTTDLGANGGNLGIGGLRNATGFKLDTFSNVYQSPQGDTTNADSFQNGWAEDPALGQFGAWVNTTYKKIETQGQPAREYHLWWAETDAGSAQRLDSRDLDGRFHRFAIQYDGVTKELTVSYESNLGIKQWKKKVSTPEELMSMVVTATTGTYKNLQQFQIKRFDFYQSASVDVRYVDEQGREIAEGSVTYPQGAFKGKPYTTEQKTIPGYSFIRMGNGSLPPSGTLADWDTNGTVTYVYRKGATDTKTERQTVSRTIKYRYRDGVTSGRPALPRPVTQTVEFTRQVVGGRPGPWTPARQNFGGVNTPSITGFTPDRTRVDGITVNASSTPGTEIVYYDKNDPKVTTETKDVTRTVAYEYEDGVTAGRSALPREVQQNVQFTRQVSEDPVTGAKTYGNWTPSRQTVPAVDTPAIKGFTPNKPRVNSASVSPTDPSWREIVSYRKNDPKVTTETKDVTRTVAYEYEDGVTAGRPALPREVQQNVQFTRQVSEDPVTGVKTYGNWTPARQTVPAVDTPVIKGFTPNKPRVNSASVSPTDPSWREIVLYRKNDPKVTTETKDVTRTVAYEYEDGVTAGRPALPREVQQNVQFTRQVSEDPVTGAKTYGNWTPTRQTVPAVDTPTIKGFTPNKPRVNSASVAPTDPSWREIVSYRKNDPKVTTETKDVTRTVAYEYEDGVTRNRPTLPQPVEQTVQFTRQVSEDPVTGQKTYGNWTPARQNVAAVDSPEVAGFTPNKPRVNSASVAPTDPSWREIVSYSAATQKGSIVYRTDGKNGVEAKTLHTDNVTGNSNTPVNYTTTAKINEFKQLGYDLVSDGFTKAGGQKFDSNNNVDQTWEVVLTPRIETKQEKKDVTRNVRYQYKDGVTAGRPALPRPVTQTTSFTRPVSVNKVTGVETPGQWNKQSEELPKVDSPAVTGFTPDKPSVPAATVTPTSPNEDEVVSYSQDDQRGIIEYVTDGQNGVPVKTLYTDGVTGKSGEDVVYSTANRITQLQQAGYKLVSDGFTQPSGQKFDNDKTKDQVWKVVVTPVVETTQETKNVTRTIQYQYGDGVTAGRPALPRPVTQTTSFTRPVSVNKVTGVETPGQWNKPSEELPKVDSPAVTGFTPDKPSVPASTVTPTSPNEDEVVSYSQDDQRGIIEYVTDGQNGVPAKTLYTDGVTGKSGEDVVYSTASRIAQLQQAGYKLVSDGFTQPNGQKFDADKTQDQVWKVVVTPIIETRTETKRVLRIIEYQYGDGVTEGRPALPPTVTQPVTFTRPVSVNKVTGEKTPGAWDKPNANLPEVTSPAITGYSPDKPKVPGVTVDPTSENPVEVVKYNLDEQRGSIKYVTDGKNGVEAKTLYTDSVAGKSGEPVAYSTASRIEQLKQAGYKLVSDGFTQPSGQKFDNDKTKDQVWKVVVTPRVDDNTNPADLNSKVTRTIKYQYADGQTAGRPDLKAPVTQEATFTRTGKINAVTGEKTFTAWTPATKELAQEATPVVTGFVADKANVAAKTVTPDDKDSEEVVQYKKAEVPPTPTPEPKPVPPTPAPVPNKPVPNKPVEPRVPGTTTLPNTGEKSSSVTVLGLGIVATLAGVSLIKPRLKED